MLSGKRFFENIGIKSAIPERRIKGSLYKEPEDFIVNEIHENFTCSAEAGRMHTNIDAHSPYIYATLVKKNISTFEACSKFCTENGLDYSKDVSFCGLKDTLGITSQLICMRNFDGLKIKNTVFDNFFLKDFTASDRKLEVGSHIGNRFIIRVRDVDEKEAKIEIESFESIVRRGFPNFYGPQRFGIRQNNHFLGKLLLKGYYEKFLFDFLTFSRNESEEIVKARCMIKNYFGSWDKCLELMDSVNGMEDEKHIVSSLLDGTNLLDSIKRMKMSKFFIHSYSSYLFNMALSYFLKNDWYDASLEKLGKNSELDDMSSRIYDKIFKTEGICIDDFDACEFDVISHKRNTLFRVDDFSFRTENGDATVEFTLGKGEYASLVLCFLIDSDIRKLC